MSDAYRVDCCHACVDWDALTKETLNLKSHLKVKYKNEPLAYTKRCDLFLNFCSAVFPDLKYREKFNILFTSSSVIWTLWVGCMYETVVVSNS